MPRVLVITDDRLGARMAGPAIRACELARHLQGAELASMQPLEAGWTPGFPVHGGLTRPALVELAKDFEVLVAGGFLLAQVPELRRLGKFTVLDLYDPMLFEELAGQQRTSLEAYLYAEHHRYLAEEMGAADFMICASERQRDYWLGRLCALGRLGPELYAMDASANRLIGVVPFGLPSEPPAPGAKRLRGRLPGVTESSCIALWGGGIWDWFDPLSPIQAAAELQDTYPDLKLVFMAGRSPNPTTPEMPMAARARELAAELGALGRSVHFMDEWVPYSERGALLLEADLGISSHYDHLETRFSFRTRILDYLWAGLPILTTRGDAMADLVEREQLGLTVAPEDVAGWRTALAGFASDAGWAEERAANVTRVRGRFTWDRAIAPLRAYCEAPYQTPKARSTVVLKGPAALAAKAALSLKEEGLEGLVTRGKRFLARRSGGSADA